MPGTTAFTRTGANSRLAIRAMASMAASIAAKVPVATMGFLLIQPENRVIEPLLRILGPACLMQWCWPQFFDSKRAFAATVSDSVIFPL